jgi:hypothetical protein
MSFLSRKAGRHEITPVERKPVPDDRTHPLENVSLFATSEDPHVGPPAPRPRRAWRKVDVPTAPYVEVHAPHTPPAQPAATPVPRPAPRPYVPEPPAHDPLTAERADMLTRYGAAEPAVLARDDDRFSQVCSVHCGGRNCTVTSTRYATRGFVSLYAAAEAGGWRKDWFGTWTCPACQQKPGYWPVSTPAPWGVLGQPAVAEHALIRRTAEAAGPAIQMRDACRQAAAHPRYHVNAKAIGAAA